MFFSENYSRDFLLLYQLYKQKFANETAYLSLPSHLKTCLHTILPPNMFPGIVVINVYKRFFLFLYKNAFFNVFFLFFQRFFLFLKNVEQ